MVFMLNAKLEVQLPPPFLSPSLHLALRAQLLKVFNVQSFALRLFYFAHCYLLQQPLNIPVRFTGCFNNVCVVVSGSFVMEMGVAVAGIP
jgi:hypothetical protein